MKNGKLYVVLGVVFAVFQASLLAIAGFDGHGAAFWVSYGFSFLPFIAAAICIPLADTANGKNWLFGYPVMRYSGIYLAASIAFCILFMLLDPIVGWVLPFVVQIILLGADVILILGCMQVKEVVEQTHQQVERKTAYMLSLRATADGLAAKCAHPAAKAACVKLAEAVRFSDPVSNDQVAPYEQVVAQALVDVDTALNAGEMDKIISLCALAEQKLAERNRICKLTKSNN